MPRFASNAAGEIVRRAWEAAARHAAIGPRSARAHRFGRFGDGSMIAFPPGAIYNEHYTWIGVHTLIAPHVTIAVGMAVGQRMVTDPVVRIGDRCVIGRGSAIVAHLDVEIGDDVWTGHHVYITDQNHGYEDLELPIGRQVQPEKPVVIGSGTWLGTGVIVLPGAHIGSHVAVGANSVVTGDLPDRCVAAGVPARVLRRYSPDAGWTTS